MSKLKYTIVKDRRQYDLYCDKLESLTESHEPRLDDEIELLSLLVQKYNDEQAERYQINFNPVELLIDLLNENNLTQIELAKRIESSPQLISDIVKYRREITKKTALKLSAEFNIEYYAFLKPYKLKKAG